MADNNSCCISVRDVYKSFGANHVLNGVSFKVNQGEIAALLGHNGAGKTTLLRIVLGLIDVDSGDVEVLQKNPLTVGESIRKVCGVLSEDTGLYESLTVYDNLRFFAEVYGCPKKTYDKRIDELLEMFEISDKKNEVIKNFSMGMKKKVAIIRTILHNPKIVLLDEPTNSLDPVSINVLHKIMMDMREKYATTFIITTHNLDEVMKVCDKIVIVKNGKSVVQRTLNLNTYLRTQIELLEYTDHKLLIQIVSKYGYDFSIQQNNIILNKADKEHITKIIRELVLNNVPVCGAMSDTFDLNKLYMEVEECGNE